MVRRSLRWGKRLPAQAGANAVLAAQHGANESFAPCGNEAYAGAGSQPTRSQSRRHAERPAQLYPYRNEVLPWTAGDGDNVITVGGSSGTIRPAATKRCSDDHGQSAAVAQQPWRSGLVWT
jgi:hypothetical protein